MFQCFNCHTPWKSTLRQPAVKETCDHCGAYLHCCKNCRFHRQGYPNACYIPDTEKIADKRRANFCDEFEFRSASKTSVRTSSDKEPDSVKEWLLESDNKVRDFKDLFND
jgi:hypothetical protein